MKGDMMGRGFAEHRIGCAECRWRDDGSEAGKEI